VFIPGAAKYTEDALKNGWIVKESIHNLVLHEPMIAVPQGNPAGITGLEDLARPGVKVALGDPKGPAIGRVSKKLLAKNKLSARVDANVTVFAPTVNQLLIYVALEQVDAAIIWGDLVTWAEGQGKVETVRIRPEKNIIMTIPTALTVQGRDNPLARAFNELMGSPEGMAVWKKWGFEPCAR
jgi:molybdate transport system substrate-binding protein